MRYYAEFYQLHDTQYINVCGSHSVYYMDGRWSRLHMCEVAADICRQRGFDGWRLARGPHTRPFYLTAAVRGV